MLVYHGHKPVLLKCNFSEKATKVCSIVFMVLRDCAKCLKNGPTDDKLKTFRTLMHFVLFLLLKNLLSKKISPVHNNMGFLGLLCLKQARYPVHSDVCASTRVSKVVADSDDLLSQSS